MKRIWTIIGVRDVSGSFKWYQSLFGQSATAPAHADFGQILGSDGTVLLCLHEWGAHEHPALHEYSGPQKLDSLEALNLGWAEGGIQHGEQHGDQEESHERI